VSHWYFQPILDSYGIVAATATVLVLLLLIGPAFRRTTRTKRAVLILLRLLVIAAIVVSMLRPTHVSTTRRPQTAVLIVLFDQSRSMQLPHAASQQSRWDAQLHSIRQAEPMLQALADKMEVRVYSYGRQLHALELSEKGLVLPPSPDGSQTDIGTNLHEALQREVGKRLAGVVLLGDGRQTAFAPAVEIQEAGRELARLGYPLYTVPFGPPTDTVQARDVAVENLQDQYTVFVKNEVPVHASVRVHGYVNRTIPVEMVVAKPGGATETIGPVQVTAREDGEQVPVELHYVPEQTGSYKLTLRAAEQAGELVTKNNQLSAFLRVLEGGLKILYLEGDLREEQKFIRRSLAGSPDMDVDFMWIDHRARDRWPVDVADRFRDPQYDVFVLGDLDAQALGEANLGLLAEAVGQGKGLALLGGFHSFSAGGYQKTPLADVMPIVMDLRERQDFDAPILRALHLDGPLRMVPIRAHPVVSLASDAANAAAWSRLPPLNGANRFGGIKEAAGVRVIAETERGGPLLVVGEYGRGRVLALAGDSTYRWCMHGYEAEHKRFWRQVILWLVRREDLQQDEVWVKLAQRRFQPDSRITFETGVNNPTGEAIAEAVLRAELVGPDQGRSDLRLVRDGKKWTGTVESLKVPGDYAIIVTAELDGKSLGSARGEFLVFDHDIELSNSAADHDQLARLAALTSEFGGRMVAPEQLPALFEEIRDRPPAMDIEVQTKWQLADTPQDAWAVFLLFVTILTTEWFLRKKWGLV
jgi:uncharacterized membrane protein